MNKKSRMYEVDGIRVKTWNPFVGCKFNCSYCYAPEIYKRFSKCDKCKAFTPHFHPERLNQKFKVGETVFVCSMGDISFASFEQFVDILEIISDHPETTFYIQSKNPAYFMQYLGTYGYFICENLMFSCNNVVLGTTIETSRSHCFSPENSPFCPPYQISRAVALQNLNYTRKYVTIEPIFDFDAVVLIAWLKEIAPEFVYVGYLNPKWKAKKLQIREPPLQKTLELIEELEEFTEVRRKSIRNAWNEC